MEVLMVTIIKPMFIFPRAMSKTNVGFLGSLIKNLYNNNNSDLYNNDSVLHWHV